jgi:hypothetical protein
MAPTVRSVSGSVNQKIGYARIGKSCFPRASSGIPSF